MGQILAIDVGYGNTKAVWNRRLQNGQIVWDEICFRSVVNQVYGDYSNDQIGGLDRVLVHINEKMYFVGPKATLAGGLLVGGSDYMNSDQYEALICGAISYMMKSINEVVNTIDTIVLGLPVAGFDTKWETLQQIGIRTHAVPLPASFNNGKKSIPVTSKQVLVVPQPYGSIRYAHEIAIDNDLASDDVIAMVIDPGHSTFDWFITHGMDAQMEMSNSFEGGVSIILKKVAACISKDSGNGTPNLGLVERGFQSGFMNFGNQMISMDKYFPLVKQAADEIVIEFLGQFDPQKEGISRIILAGGGAKFFEKSLSTKLPTYQIETLRESVMTNARGFWIHGLDMKDV